VTRKIRIAHLSCGSEYSGVQKEIQDAVEAVNAEIVFPEVDTEAIKDAVQEWGLEVASPDLQLMIARAKSIVEGGFPVDAVFISTCFRCAEAAITQRIASLHSRACSFTRDKLLVHGTNHCRNTSNEDGSARHHRAQTDAARS